jgi:allantoinase
VGRSAGDHYRRSAVSTLVIRGGTVVLPTGQRPADIAIIDGTISAIGSEVRDGDETIDARNLVIFPGVVDAHVHFNEPGRADWEGWEAGTRGAAAGGVTTVLEMPLNAHPPTTTPAAFDEKVECATRSALVDFGLWGGLVPEHLGAIEALHRRGVVGFKAFMSDSGIADFQRVSDGVLAIGLKAAARLGAIVGVHAESQEMLEDLESQRRDPTRLSWCRARPPAAEVEAIQRLLTCMRGAGKSVRAHVVHVSCAAGLAQVDAARRKGVAITAETCPHYLAFTEEDFERMGPPLKCAPPLRDAATREALWEEVLAGRVDIVASDHSPCPASDKQKGEHDIWRAWGGIAGIQATLPVLLTDGRLSFERIAHLTATAPAQLFGLFPRKGTIAVGADADFAIVDPQHHWRLGASDLQTKSGVSAYLGREFTGRVVRTIVRGRTVFRDGEIVGRAGWGQLLRPNHAN